jgi:UDP-3-O-acyl-N-acetylglucosamine deacetylase
MDLIGDLALLGSPLHGRIHARKAGHALHIEFARAIHAALSGTSRQAVEDSDSPRAASGSQHQ